MILTEDQLESIKDHWDNYRGDGVSTNEVYGMIDTIRQLRACLYEMSDAWTEGYNEDWDGFNGLWGEYQRVMGWERNLS